MSVSVCTVGKWMDLNGVVHAAGRLHVGGGVGREIASSAQQVHTRSLWLTEIMQAVY